MLVYVGVQLRSCTPTYTSIPTLLASCKWETYLNMLSFLRSGILIGSKYWLHLCAHSWSPHAGGHWDATEMQLRWPQLGKTYPFLFTVQQQLKKGTAEGNQMPFKYATSISEAVVWLTHPPIHSFLLSISNAQLLSPRKACEWKLKDELDSYAFLHNFRMIPYAWYELIAINVPF